MKRVLLFTFLALAQAAPCLYHNQKLGEIQAEHPDCQLVATLFQFAVENDIINDDTWHSADWPCDDGSTPGIHTKPIQCAYSLLTISDQEDRRKAGGATQCTIGSFQVTTHRWSLDNCAAARDVYTQCMKANLTIDACFGKAVSHAGESFVCF